MRVGSWDGRLRFIAGRDGIAYAAEPISIVRLTAMEKNMTTKHPNSSLVEMRDDLSEVTAVSEQSLPRLSRVLLRLRSKPVRSQRQASVLARLSRAAAFVLVGYAVLEVVPGIFDSTQQRALHRAAVHRDDSVIRTGVTTQFKRSILLHYRDVHGTLHLLLADEDRVSKFVNDTLIYLDTESQRIRAKTAVRINALLAEAFVDRDACIAAYADWYFAWSRSWALLKEASVGGLSGALPSNVQGILEGSRNAVEAYLIRNYQRFVLRPEFRNPVLEAGLARFLAGAHEEYLTVITTLDDRVQDYLNRETQHLERLGPLAKLDVSLAWDQQKWKAPRAAVDDEPFWTALRGAGAASVSALVARSTVPAVERAVSTIFAKAATKAVTAMRPQIIGAAAGTMVEPGLGTAAGWALGAAGGVAIDYLVSKGQEWLDRPEFVRANGQALDATVQEWSRVMQRDLFVAVDAWFEDTRGVVAEFKIQRKIPTG
ncbi:hypothetical protein [Bradyrhizobium sp. CCBAU 45389]|uniref:hypothetical protein n=1 Tax=Bradyrhizobium sp. CCBAU 45389 TaxID=858429 RepID=UPI0023065896|nr:hypothetical protein [Bradyrhizobium sp. CCBAU 45389]MDA9400789.1 hypothetical protein [Bradyrhizobium sp. CCBAU 45389]